MYCNYSKWNSLRFRSNLKRSQQNNMHFQVNIIYTQFRSSSKKGIHEFCSLNKTFKFETKFIRYITQLHFRTISIFFFFKLKMNIYFSSYSLFITLILLILMGICLLVFYIIILLLFFIFLITSLDTFMLSEI